MGAKKSKSDEGETPLNPHELRRLKTFLEKKLSRPNSESLNRQDINKIWQDVLVPDLLNTYREFLMNQDLSNSGHIHLGLFLKLYIALVKGDNETRASCIAALASPPGYKIGGEHLSYNKLFQYLSDLFESYFKGAEYRNDTYYKSWRHLKHAERASIEGIVTGLCSDLQRTNDDVALSELESWLSHSGLINALHSHVLSFMYGLEAEETISNLVPMARLPATTTPICLNTSEVAFLNSIIPFENRTKWRLLFSTSLHGESFVKFVGSIMNQGPLLLVIECDERSKFGGYVSENINPGPRWVGTEDSFLFKLSPKPEVFVSTGYNNNYVYLNMNLTSLPIGMGMGGQFDYWGLWIDSQFGNGECSESCTTYKNYKMIATKKKFRIRNMEVWGVGEPPPTAAERGERGPSSVLDKDAAASHILEMAGRQIHSKGLREEPEL